MYINQHSQESRAAIIKFNVSNDFDQHKSHANIC